MNFKRFSTSDNQWHDVPYYIHNTATDTITTLPAVIYANDNNATVGLKGNMEQSGTPTPTTPIQPSECGDKTANLFDKDDDYTVSSTTNNYTLTGLLPNHSYTCSTNFTYPTKTTASIYFGGGSSSINGVWSDLSRTKQTDSNGNIMLYIRWKGQSYAPDITEDVADGTIWIMVNEGSTALPYEPYGQYKIPILSNSQTTNVYLGEVQSTRRIKKLVLTGEEGWGGTSRFRINLSGQIGAIAPICTHYRGVITAAYAELADGSVTVNGGTGLTLAIYDSVNQTSLTAWKSYLAQQYANGTPVCVWYVLATPTTTTLNEPLRKIGDYADEVSGISIPTIAGANTLSIGTTLQPSEVTVNYKGWHPVADVHEYDSNYTIATMQALTIAQLQTHTISDLQKGEWS